MNSIKASNYLPPVIKILNISAFVMFYLLSFDSSGTTDVAYGRCIPGPDCLKMIQKKTSAAQPKPPAVANPVTPAPVAPTPAPTPAPTAPVASSSAAGTPVLTQEEDALKKAETQAHINYLIANAAPLTCEAAEKVSNTYKQIKRFCKSGSDCIDLADKCSDYISGSGSQGDYEEYDKAELISDKVLDGIAGRIDCPTRPPKECPSLSADLVREYTREKKDDVKDALDREENLQSKLTEALNDLNDLKEKQIEITEQIKNDQKDIQNQQKQKLEDLKGFISKSEGQIAEAVAAFEVDKKKLESKLKVNDIEIQKINNESLQNLNKLRDDCRNSSLAESNGGKKSSFNDLTQSKRKARLKQQRAYLLCVRTRSVGNQDILNTNETRIKALLEEKNLELELFKSRKEALDNAINSLPDEKKKQTEKTQQDINELQTQLVEVANKGQQQLSVNLNKQQEKSSLISKLQNDIYQAGLETSRKKAMAECFSGSTGNSFPKPSSSSSAEDFTKATSSIEELEQQCGDAYNEYSDSRKEDGKNRYTKHCSFPKQCEAFGIKGPSEARSSENAEAPAKSPKKAD